ncbi:hypothetical protein ACR777_11560 [Sphingobacterium spiritivorum]|uniref:hypothetical protein n=1 Tax=Sphingobacterium spiritivorum TaxID=258 RepID=UPI003DA43C7D
MLNSKLVVYIFVFIPFCFLSAQEKDTTLALLENKEQNKEFLNYIYSQNKNQNKILIIYNDKFYNLSQFNLIDSIQRLNLNVTIIHNQDSIKKILSRDVKSVILLKDSKKKSEKKE